MDFSAVDFGPMAALLGTTTLLVVIDTVLGAASALAGGTFRWEYLYAVARTKGLVLFQMAVLAGAGAITPFADFELVGIEADPFSALALGLALTLVPSLIASIYDNIGKRDTTAPQGVAPVDVPTPDA